MHPTLIGLLAIAFMALCAFAATVPSVKDALVKATRALPASTTAVTSTAIDTGVTTNGVQACDVEYVLTAPAVTQAQLPDTKTFTYAIIESDNADLSSPTVVMAAAITQTGSTGAASATRRYKPASTGKRYLGFTVTPSGSGTGDASAATATLEAVF